MLTYIIDGFNLIYKIGEMADSPTPHSDLTHFLKRRRLTGSRANKVIVVFDGHPVPSMQMEREFDIRFSNDGTADDVIKSIVDKTRNKKTLIVVSDDREIRSHAGVSGAQVSRPAAFLSNASKGKPKTSVEDDRGISCSEMIEITEELEKKWVK